MGGVYSWPAIDWTFNNKTARCKFIWSITNEQSFFNLMFFISYNEHSLLWRKGLTQTYFKILKPGAKLSEDDL